MEHPPRLIVGQHYPAIDGLRGIAVLLVIWFHASHFATIGYSVEFSGFMYGYNLLTVLGESGVDLFFVLSGFLITGILIDTARDKHNLRKFYIRRSLRIFPLYYFVFILFFICMTFLIGGQVFTDGKTYMYLFYLQNWMITHNEDQFILLDHTWSLAVEEQFYLIWPVLFLSFYKGDNVKPAIILCISVILLSWFFRVYFAGMGQYKWAYTFSIARFDGLAAGALLSVLCIHYKQSLLKYRAHFIPVMFLLFALILYMLFSPNNKIDGGHLIIQYGLILFTILYTLLLSCVVCSLKTSAFRKILSFKGLREVGKVSYGIYLFHSPVMMILARYLYPYEMPYFQIHFALLIGGFFLSYVLAAMSYRIFEKPILALKDKYAPLD